MKAAGIIAEYNPFHNGHALHIERTRESGCTHIAVVMSGLCTQRGEPAVFGKDARCRAALAAGADLVIELPLPWAVSSAERFARGAVSLLAALGCIETLSFGSESGNVGLITQYAERLDALEQSGRIREKLAEGASYPAARQAALSDLFGGQQNPGANDRLAAEYLRAARYLSVRLNPLAVKRAGAGHDESASKNGIASASAIRAMLQKGEWEEAMRFVPGQAAAVYRAERKAGRAPFDEKLFGSIAFAQLRRLDKADFAALPDVTEGLENRIFHAVRLASNLPELAAMVKTKRYTMTRINRILLSAALSIKAQPQGSLPPYLRVLGFNERGLEILRAAKENSTLPILTRFPKAESLGGSAAQVYRMECLAADLLALCRPAPAPCGAEQRYTPVTML